MFKWTHDLSVDVNVPIEKIWGFVTNPTNWPKWMDQLESCHLETGFEKGSIVKAKLNKRNAFVNILIAEVVPFDNFKILIKVPFFTQESLCFYHEIFPGKTKATIHTSVSSIVTPFLKSYFKRKVEEQIACAWRLLETQEMLE